MALINTTTTGVLGTTLFGDGNGDLTVQKDGVTINKVVNQIAFSAYASAAQNSITNSTPTKVTFDVEEYDTASCFSSSRFTPTVAGYYLITCGLQIPYNAYTHMALCMIYKNGSIIKQGVTSVGNPVAYPQSIGSVIIYLNGSTDYVEMYAYGYNSAGSTYNTYPGIDRTFIQGCLIKAA